MDAVEDAVVVLPEPVFLNHYGMDFVRIGLGGTGLFAIDAIGKDDRELLVTGLVRDEAAGGERLLGLGVKLLGRGEEIDECQRMFFRHALHGGGVEFQVGVFLGAIGEIAAFGEVFVSDG